MPEFSKSLEQAIHYSLELANVRRHSLATLEHLLLALTYEESSARVLMGCGANLEELRSSLIDFIEEDLITLIEEDEATEAVPTSAYQRVIQRAAIHIQSSKLKTVHGSNVLVAITAERESNSAYFLQEQDVTRYDMVNFISHGVAKDRDLMLSMEMLKEIDVRYWLEDEGTAPSAEQTKKKRRAQKAVDSVNLSAEHVVVQAKVVRDIGSVVLLARSLELQIKLEIERANHSKPNFQSETERKNFENYQSFLGEMAKGLSELVNDLAGVASSKSDKAAKKATERVIHLRDRFSAFFQANKEEAVFYCGKMPAMLGTIALFQMAGAHMITATPILMALFGGDRIAKLVKSTMSKND